MLSPSNTRHYALLMAVACLGSIALCGTTGICFLAAWDARVPDVLTAIVSAAVGALSGIVSAPALGSNGAPQHPAIHGHGAPPRTFIQ